MSVVCECGERVSCVGWGVWWCDVRGGVVCVVCVVVWCVSVVCVVCECGMCGV